MSEEAMLYMAAGTDVNFIIYPTGGNISYPTGRNVTLTMGDNLIFRDAEFEQPYSKFSPEIDKAAWKLLEEAMTPGQYFAFMEGNLIEKESADKKYRLFIEKAGKFSILEGGRGEGIAAAHGNVRSGKYPLGDEIYTFIAWFENNPAELIGAWNCGNYTIKDDRLTRR